MESRTADLQLEHRKLMEEKEFYPPPLTVPAKLRQDIDAAEGTLEGVRANLNAAQAEVIRINSSLDRELEALRKLWAKGK